MSPGPCAVTAPLHDRAASAVRYACEAPDRRHEDIETRVAIAAQPNSIPAEIVAGNRYCAGHIFRHFTGRDDRRHSPISLPFWLMPFFWVVRAQSPVAKRGCLSVEPSCASGSPLHSGRLRLRRPVPLAEPGAVVLRHLRALGLRRAPPAG